jgi:hypothetical protein
MDNGNHPKARGAAGSIVGEAITWRGASASISLDGRGKPIMASQDSRDLVRRAEQIYDQRLRKSLEATHRDSFVAIEPDSGDYFLGRTLSEASAEARKVYPDRRTYVLRVGHPTAVTIGSAFGDGICR